MQLGDIAHLLTSRHAEIGTAVVLVGDIMISILVEPFSPDEAEAIDWANQVDDTELLAVFGMSDGRDFILLKRLHTKQSVADAVLELQQAIDKNFST